MYFVDQVNWEIQDCVWGNLYEIEDITRTIGLFESRLDKLYAICSNYKGVLGEEAEQLGFDIEDEKLVTSIRTKISDGRIMLDALKEKKELAIKQDIEKNLRDKQNAENQRLQQAQVEEKIKLDNLLSCAENLHFEIETRYNTLTTKCII